MLRTALNRAVRLMGFDSSGAAPPCFSPALAFAIPFSLLPWLLLLPLDSDRALPLAFVPAILLSLRNIRSAPKIELLLLAWIGVSLIVSALGSDHTPRALVMSASVFLTLLAGCAAAPLARNPAAVRLMLAGILTGAVAGTFMVGLGVGFDRMSFPVYWSARLMGAHQFAGCAAALVLLRLSPTGFTNRIFPFLGAAVVWTGLAWSGSRAPALGLAVFVALWFWRGSRDDRRFLLRWATALSFLALACSYPLGTPFPQMGWWHAFTRTAAAVDSGAVNIAIITSSRTDYWMASWQQILRSPWFGNGADAYLFLSPTQPGNQPHCMPLQWLLEYGVFGLIAWLALLARSVRSLGSPASASTWSAAIVAGAAGYSLFEGAFYHMASFLPASVLAGLALGFATTSGPPLVAFSRPLLRIPVLVSATLLLIHNWLGLMLLKAPNVSPDSPPARLLRAFPSTTHGITNWTERWRRNDPVLAMDWIQWAQTVSPNPGALHAHAAQVYLWQKNFASAEAEMLRCLETVNPAERTDVQHVLANIARWRAEHAAAQPTIP